MPSFMLDTNILSDILRNANGGAARMLENHGLDAVCTSAIVASELRYGVTKKASPRLAADVDYLLTRIAVLDYPSAAATTYGLLRADLERRGMVIGANDLLIAAHARSLDLTLVTDNIGEFSRIDGLKLENWIERPQE
jgi:tRNA(fMet)-specific endonuclease VapC